MILMKIENWRLVSLNVNDEIIGLSVINQKYQEFGSYLAIAGNITGCPEIVRDGAFIRTSQIKQVNLEEGYVTTYSGHGLAKFIKSKLHKNIAFVLPTTNISGGVNVVIRHIGMLKKQGYDVTVINMDDNDTFVYYN